MKGLFDKRIRNALVKAQAISEKKADEALEISAKDPALSYAEVLTEKGYVREIDYLGVIAVDARMPPIDITKVSPDEKAMAGLSQDMAKYYGVLPLSKMGKLLTLAVGNPYDLPRLDELASVTGCELRPLLAGEASLKRTIQKVYNPVEKQILDQLQGDGVSQGVTVKKSGGEEEELSRLVDITATGDGEDAPLVKLVNLLLTQALRDRATDLHIEPFEKRTQVRCRVDGKLREMLSPPKSMHNKLITRIKVMAGLDVAERGLPQDGKIQVRFEGRQVDIRVSLLPTVCGEKCVLRILDSKMLQDLHIDNLGFEKESEEIFRRAATASYGMVLVTGPTGSGKSTTLYVALQDTLSREENVITVEDPVEYQIKGVNQVNVNVKRGLTFAAALRSILRQDPDIVLIGEIRDQETADIAIKAALTGHLVLGTLHTNDAASAITRLADMGIDPFMVSSALICVSAQRLLRKLCEACKRPMEKLPPEDYLISVGFKPEEVRDLVLYEPVGCSACHKGYKGRFAILEAIELDDTIRRMIIDGKSHIDIRDYAIQKKNMITLRRCAVLSAIRGRTSLQEGLSMTLGASL